MSHRCHPYSAQVWAVVILRFYGCNFCYYQETVSHSNLPNPPNHYNLPTPSSTMFSRALGEWMWRPWDWAPQLGIFFGHAFYNGLCCKEKFLDKVKTTLTCEHTDTCLDCLEGLYWFSKVVVVAIPPISMTLHIRISYCHSCWADLKSNWSFWLFKAHVPLLHH